MSSSLPFAASSSSSIQLPESIATLRMSRSARSGRSDSACCFFKTRLWYSHSSVRQTHGCAMARLVDSSNESNFNCSHRSRAGQQLFFAVFAPSWRSKMRSSPHCSPGSTVAESILTLRPVSREGLHALNRSGSRRDPLDPLSLVDYIFGFNCAFALNCAITQFLTRRGFVFFSMAMQGNEIS
jgi:hypothetical protein